MMDHDAEIEYALRHTELVRPPEQRLNTFGVTKVHYYLLAEPMDSVNETRIREGRVIAERPRIVTPSYLLNVFEGFGDHARKQAEALLARYGFDPNILEYKYRNEMGNTWTLSENISQVILKINEKIDDESDPLAAILKCPDDAWQISLMMFIMSVTRSSVSKNIAELDSRGLFERQYGIPKFVRDEIDDLFRAASKDRSSIKELGSKLQSYGVFEQYQDRFFTLLRRR
ncbi:hypothetical protein M1N22_02380 [Dehalococcoidia bacterium]|nr:hypothetical protein [Dehalococcoidia bacterium]MCL0064641.1 hypothetical protein [Dehalococcoidia bacterium]